MMKSPFLQSIRARNLDKQSAIAPERRQAVAKAA
jgi:hypothetical protein